MNEYNGAYGDIEVDNEPRTITCRYCDVSGLYWREFRRFAGGCAYHVDTYQT